MNYVSFKVFWCILHETFTHKGPCIHQPHPSTPRMILLRPGRKYQDTNLSNISELCMWQCVCVCLGSIYLLFNLWFLASRKNNPTVHEPSGKQGWQCKIFILQPFVSFLPVCRSYFSEYRIIVIYIYILLLLFLYIR